jgi:hypothetical protein
MPPSDVSWVGFPNPPRCDGLGNPSSLIEQCRLVDCLQRDARRGTVLVMFAICLIVIMGLVALVIDGGLLRAEHIRVRAVTDAAALAGACQLYKNYANNNGADADGSAAKGALAIALDNGYANDGTKSTIVVNIPPATGKYAGLAGYVEVLITSKQDRYFSRIWSPDPLYVRARTVARGAWVPFAAGVLSLDLNDKGAVSVKGNGAFNSSGPVYINSNSSTALSVSGGGIFKAPSVDITGGYGGSGITGTVTTGVHPTPDPLAYLPAPGEPGAPPVPPPGSIIKTSLGGSNYQYDLYPGTYNSLPTFNSGDKVVFHQASSNANGGIFYLASGGLSSKGALVMAAGETGGLMIYNAGAGSGNTISISGNSSSSVTLGPRTDGPYTGIVLFQSRTLTGDLTITGNGIFNVAGTIYAPAARIHVTGNGATSGVGSQWITRELYLAGNGSIDVTYSNTTVARTRIIAIVE